jgi:hypothetical protein
MTTAAAVSSPFERWHTHFSRNRDGSGGLPWLDPRSLTPAERRAVGPSIRMFELGEFARGRSLTRRAAAQADFACDPWFLPTLQLFIAEEQQHSAMLGRFLDREGISRIAVHWTDGAFRRLRKLAGLELCVVTLVTAEVLAVPFYRALRDATRSPLLRAICIRILCDEAAHLNYQALTLGTLRRPLTERSCAWRRALHSALFHGTALLVWSQHRSVFHAAQRTFGSFWREARSTFAFLSRRIEQEQAAREVLDLN